MVLRFGNWSIGIDSQMANVNNTPLALIILDGWGYSSGRESNAIALAHTPNYDYICRNFPYTLLSASGDRVGLAADAPGDSEVGHLSIGTGRIVKTISQRIREAIDDGSLFESQALNSAIDTAAMNSSAIHLVGLVSDGGVHSSLESLFALLRLAKRKGIRDNVFVHAILDGRDVPQRTADVYVELLEIKLAELGLGRIATLCGRHYAMDKSEHWDRTVRAFTMLVHSEGEPAVDAVEAIHGSYLRGISEEFIQPIVLEEPLGSPVARIRDGDTVIFFNHRGDRMRQLVRTLAVPDFSRSGFPKPKISAVCLTEYDKTFELPVAFEPAPEPNGLSQVFSRHGVLNCRMTEAEKFSLVTNSFNGGAARQETFENGIMIPASGEMIHDAPEAGSFKITDRLLRGLESGENEVFIVNLAAADLVAHTGNLEKTVEAVQFVDTCLGGIIGKLREMGGTAIITADHGNVEEMRDPRTGKPNPNHTSNPVPFHLVAGNVNGLALREDGALEDVAPTLLGMLGIDKPEEMTGRDLRI